MLAVHVVRVDRAGDLGRCLDLRGINSALDRENWVTRLSVSNIRQCSVYPELLRRARLTL